MKFIEVTGCGGDVAMVPLDAIAMIGRDSDITCRLYWAVGGVRYVFYCEESSDSLRKRIVSASCDIAIKTEDKT